mgnify:CR=1 FL=1|tara:strand:- start:111 stop:911 length:801 start_codon:yes stop_codon:yes gene_type:complete
MDDLQRTHAISLDKPKIKNARFGMVHMNSLNLYFMLFLMFAGWVVIGMNVFVDTIRDKPFWNIMGSLLIIFAVFFLLITSLVYYDTKLQHNDSTIKSKFSDMFQGLIFSFEFLFSRMNIFFGEVFLMFAFIAFMYLNFKYYDKVDETYKIIKFPLIFFVISTLLQILLFVYSYVIQRTDTLFLQNKLFQNVPILRNLLFPMRMLQLFEHPTMGRQSNTSGANATLDSTKILNTLLIVINMICIIVFYVYLHFLITDDIDKAKKPCS